MFPFLCNLIELSLQLIQIALGKRIRVYITGITSSAKLRGINRIVWAVCKVVGNTIDETRVGCHVAVLLHCCQMPRFQFHFALPSNNPCTLSEVKIRDSIATFRPKDVLQSPRISKFLKNRITYMEMVQYGED